MNAKMKKYDLELFKAVATRYPPSFGDKEAFCNKMRLSEEFNAGAEWATKYHKEREARLVEALEKCTQAKWQWEDGHLTEHDCAKVAKKALANYKAEGDE